MLFTLLYHRVSEEKYGNPPAMMREHLSHVAKNYRVVLPGEKISLLKPCVCLTFDDAYYDFYHYVFPLLKELHLKAVLAVPIRLILEDTSVPSQERLAVSYKTAMKENTYVEKAPFCTWKELKEMANSGHVAIASHSYHHQDLLLPGVDREKEIACSKKILEEKLSVAVKTFVYPLGKFDRRIHALVKQHYSYAMRIGSACNISWQNLSGITYRIICDALKEKDEKLKMKNLFRHLWFFLINSLRRR